MIRKTPGKYSSESVRKLGALYNLIVGRRSNGKTYDALAHMIETYYEGRKKGLLRQSAYLRRYEEDIIGRRGEILFESLKCNGKGINAIMEITDGEWDHVRYRARKWYLARWDPALDEDVIDQDPFAYGFALTSWEHDKGQTVPGICEAHFDEFIASNAYGYLQEEFTIFCNVISTLKRDKGPDAFKVFMYGNTINFDTPYFREMGIDKIKEQEPGTIQVYKYAHTGLTVAVEYCGDEERYKRSDARSDPFFAFDGCSRLDMITDGSWSLEIYPHLPHKYRPSDVVFRFYVRYGRDTLQANVIRDTSGVWIYVHQKTTPIKDEDRSLIYSQSYDPRPNWRRRIDLTFTDTERKISRLIAMDKVFYQDNVVGTIFDNYLAWCTREA